MDTNKTRIFTAELQDISVSSRVSSSTKCPRPHLNQVLESRDILSTVFLVMFLLPSHQAVECNSNGYQYNYADHQCYSYYNGILGLVAGCAIRCRCFSDWGGLE